MWAILVAAWRDLSATGRAAVVMTLILAVAGCLALAMWLGYRLDWVPDLLSRLLTNE